MKKSILGILLIVFCIAACGADIDEKTDSLEYSNIWLYQVEPWREREIQCLPYEVNKQEGPLPTNAMELMIEIEYYVYGNFVYEFYETPDYWATSCETMSTWQGDCEDFAFVVHRLLREAGFPDDNIGILITSKNHAQAFVLMAGKTYLFNLSSPRIYALEDLSSDVEILFSFNLFDESIF